MKLSMIVATARNGVIGKNNELPWYLPEDLKYFKAKTIGKPVIMGRKTYQSIGKPLPNRVNIVISKNSKIKIPGVQLVNTTEGAIRAAREACLKMGADEAMVIGGEQIYRLMLDQADCIYLTAVDLDVQGDAFFPSLDENQWQEVTVIKPKIGGELHYLFKVYEKKA